MRRLPVELSVVLGTRIICWQIFGRLSSKMVKRPGVAKKGWAPVFKKNQT